MGESVSLVDRHSVGDTITRVKHDTGGTSRGVQREHGLDGDVHGGSVEGLEHDLCHLLAVGLGVEGSLGEEDRVLLWGNTKLVVEGVMPDLRVYKRGDNYTKIFLQKYCELSLIRAECTFKSNECFKTKRK